MLADARYDSIALFYLLHCLPGTMADKARVFAHLKPHLAPGGVLFGATVLGDGTRHNRFGRALEHVYNRRGIFDNRRDTAEALAHALGEHFADVCVEQHGAVALFAARSPLLSVAQRARSAPPRECAKDGGALVERAGAQGGRLLLPSGALGGLDYIRAVRHSKNLSLRYQSRKPPAAWAAELKALGHDPAELSAPLTLFAGDAREAAARYPQNLNVAAALALAGQGFEATGIEVICDPQASGNTHVVMADSEFGSLRLSIVNTPSPANPKTSWIVGRSLMAAIEQYFSPVQML